MLPLTIHKMEKNGVEHVIQYKFLQIIKFNFYREEDRVQLISHHHQIVHQLTQNP